jgi:hypothetical protein
LQKPWRPHNFPETFERFDGTAVPFFVARLTAERLVPMQAPLIGYS